jgi:hypothetical protein
MLYGGYSIMQKIHFLQARDEWMEMQKNKAEAIRCTSGLVPE